MISYISSREQQVMELMAKGMRYEDIADELCVSRGSIADTVHALYKRWKVRNQLEAVAKAQRSGLLAVDNDPATSGEAMYLAQRYIEMAIRLREKEMVMP